MGEIIIKHRSGGDTDLHAKSSAIRLIRAEQRRVLLGEDIFTLTIQTPSPVVAEIGDKIDIFGGTYTINQLPTITKTGTKSYEQTLTFEGMQSELLDVQFILPGNTMYDDLTGDAGDFLGIIVQNANRVYPGKWAAGTVPENTETKTLSFAEKNCLAALQEICEEWGTEFEITMSESGLRTIHLKQVGVQFPFTFKYGRTGGLYELSRKNIDSKNVVTRLYVYGGSRNLGRYRSGKLCLPGKLKNQSYIENAEAIALYGLKENVKTFDEIYPIRYGLVTALGENTHTFTDDTMDFDLNEREEGDPDTTKWLIYGVDAKVRFTTGNLAGYEFGLEKYDHATKEIQIIPFRDENGHDFPDKNSPAFQMQTGDQYHFIDINLPDSYIEDAEEDLEDLAIKYYDQYKQPQVQYSLSIHPRFLEKYTGTGITNIFSIGDQISVLDEEIGVDKTLRIVAFTRDAVDPFRYTLTLSEATYTKTIINRIIDDIEDIEDIINRNNLADPFRARRNWMAAQELLDKIFDPEGYYYSEKIRPLSIETMMLQVGAKSQQFILQNTRFEPNYEGNPNHINIIGGQLIHYTVNDTITPWTLNSALVTGLQTSKSYFVYAKCERQGGGGVIIVDETQYKVDQDPNFYYFIIGHLSSVITNPDGSNGARILSLTYGSTTINGRFIRTGRIESSGGGYTYFDLDEGIIGGRIRFLSGNTEIDLEDWTGFIEQDLDDIDDLVIDLEDYIDNAFHDGIIEEAEAVAIEKYLNQIRYEKVSLEANYNKLILNPLLTGAPKTNLLNSKITFFGTTENLINTINAVIADGRVTESEKQSVDAVFNQYRIDSADFSEKLELANQAIQQTLKDIADGAAGMAADAQATANLAKAITDKFGTTIDGGLIQTVIVQFREANSEVVTAGTSGIQGAAKDQPALWAGGTYAEAISGVAKAIIRHDGSAIFEEAEVRGKLTGLEGLIGGLTLEDGRLVSANKKLVVDGGNNTIYLIDPNSDAVRTIIRPNNIATSVAAFFSGTGGGSASIAGLKGTLNSTIINLSSATINLNASGGKSFEVSIPSITLTAYIDYWGIGRSASTQVSLYLTNGSTKILIGSRTALSTGGIQSETLTTDATTRVVTVGGNWRLTAEITIRGVNETGTFSGSGTVESSATTFTASEIVNRSEIGPNGMMIATSAQNYDYMVGNTHQVRRGNYLLRITASGIEKSTNGGSNWTSL